MTTKSEGLLASIIFDKKDNDGWKRTLDPTGLENETDNLE